MTNEMADASDKAFWNKVASSKNEGKIMTDAEQIAKEIFSLINRRSLTISECENKIIKIIETALKEQREKDAGIVEDAIQLKAGGCNQEINIVLLQTAQAIRGDE